MAISGTYYIKMWLPDAKLVHGPDFQPGPPPGEMPPMGGPGGPEGAPAGGPPPTPPAPQVELKDHGVPGENSFEGEMTFHFTPNPDGTLSGDANGSPINFGYYTGDEFFKVDFPACPGRWEVWARVDAEGYIEGMISAGGNNGFPNLVYGKS